MTNKEASELQENMIAKFLMWSVVSGSGARFYPGDIQNDKWLGECKTHTSSDKKIFFKKDIWFKIAKEALTSFRYPAYFCDDGSQSVSKTWVLFPRIYSDDVVVIDSYSYDGSIIFNSDDYKKKLVTDNKDFKPVCFNVDAFGHELSLTDLNHFKGIVDII